eukprot:COSAG06_NODE_14281_length_1171_cov_1.477612_1_plen_143_part_10
MLSAEEQNVYAVAGSDAATWNLPPAYQVAAPFGADIGGASPAFFAVMADSQYDSWLTIGVTDGTFEQNGASIGVDFSSWTESAGVSINNGAVFYMDGNDGPTGGSLGDSGAVCIAQFTLPTAAYSAGGAMSALLQGRSEGSGE